MAPGTATASSARSPPCPRSASPCCPGTLYAALDRLHAQGLVAPDREETVDGRLRRYYRLTPDGIRALDVETARLRQLATAAESRLRALRPGTA